MRNFIQENKDKLNANRDEFQRTFKIALVRFMNPITGFDIVSFDDKVVKSVDGVSMSETVEQRWGVKTRELIEKLI